MIPIKLTLSGFLSYRDPVEVDFNGFDLACISGANGAGKSSLLDGITWALFGIARKRDDAVINTLSGTAEVGLTFGYEGNVYRVTRVKPKGKSTVLEFHIQNAEGKWKALTERTMRGTEARIEEILRLDYETFVNAAFFLQGKADQFTQQRAGDRKRILSSILGLEVWESYRKQAFERRKEVDGEIGKLDGRLAEINNELGEEDQRIRRLKDLEKNLKTVNDSLNIQKKALDEMKKRAASLQEQEKLVETMAGQLKRGQQNLTTLEERLRERKEEKAGYADLQGRATEIEKEQKAWQAARVALDKLDENAAAFHEADQRRREPLTEIETERTKLEGERDNLLEQKNDVAQAEKDGGDYEKDQKRYQVELAKLDKQLTKKEQLEGEMQAAREGKIAAENDNPRLKGDMDDLVRRIEQLKNTEDALCPTCGKPMDEDEQKNLIKELEGEGKEKGDKFRENAKLLKEGDKLVKGLAISVAKLAAVDAERNEKTRLLEQVNTHLEIITEESGKWEKEGAKRLKEVEGLISKEDYAKDARKTLAKIDAELKKTGYDAASHDAARKTETDLRKADEELRALEMAQAALAPLEREIGELETQIKTEGTALTKLDKEHEKAAASLETAQAEAPDVQTTESEMLAMQEEENKVRMEVGAAQQEVDVLGDLKKRKKELEGEREEHAKMVAQFKALERAFGKDGVPAMLIEQALPQIEGKTNEILDRLSNGTMSVRFVTQQAYKDKTREDMKETLDIQISDSAGIRDYEMFSGGEAFRINFAIRLALSEVLATRAGARLQTLVIDEGFGSQDAMGRQRLIEAINTVQDQFEKILIITHIDALKDVFPTRIEVEKTDRGSVVSVIT